MPNNELIKALDGIQDILNYINHRHNTTDLVDYYKNMWEGHYAKATGLINEIKSKL